MRGSSHLRRAGSILIVAVAILATSCSTSGSGGLWITSNEVPVLRRGEPYAHQLSVTGAVGPVTWSVIQGALPDGITLSPTGLLSGTPESTLGGVRVQATTGLQTDTRLLLFMDVSGEPPVATTGAPLPDGTRISLSSWDSDDDTRWVGFVNADGSLTTLTHTSPHRIAQFDPSYPLSPDGKLASTADSSVQLVDAVTGAYIRTVQPAPLAVEARPVFSPDGTRLTVGSADATRPDATRLYDTSTWQVVREVPTDFPFEKVLWSRDSSFFVVWDPGDPLWHQPLVVRTYSATDPTGASDHTLTFHGNCGSVALSITGRLAVNCDGQVRTMSALDGSDVRIVATTGCALTDCFLSAHKVGFSPDGSHVVFTDLSTLEGTSIKVAADQASAPATVIAHWIESSHSLVAFHWS